MSETQPFDYQDLDVLNVGDLLRDACATLVGGAGHVLYGIVSEEDGGIVAYAIGFDHARALVRALNAAAGEYEAEMVSLLTAE